MFEKWKSVVHKEEEFGTLLTDLSNTLDCLYLRFIIIIITIELTHSKTILEITVEIKPQPAALDFNNLSQYSSFSK